MTEPKMIEADGQRIDIDDVLEEEGDFLAEELRQFRGEVRDALALDAAIAELQGSYAHLARLIRLRHDDIEPDVSPLEVKRRLYCALHEVLESRMMPWDVELILMKVTESPEDTFSWHVIDQVSHLEDKRLAIDVLLALDPGAYSPRMYESIVSNLLGLFEDEDLDEEKKKPLFDKYSRWLGENGVAYVADADLEQLQCLLEYQRFAADVFERTLFRYAEFFNALAKRFKNMEDLSEPVDKVIVRIVTLLGEEMMDSKLEEGAVRCLKALHPKTERIMSLHTRIKYMIQDAESDNDEKMDEHLMGASEHQYASYTLLGESASKVRVFHDTEGLDEVFGDEKQSWISVNSPDLARKGLNALNSKRRTAFLAALRSVKGGLNLGNLDEELILQYYPDELIDFLWQKHSRDAKSNPDLAEVFEEAQGVNEIRMRFMKRNDSDLVTGKKAGDCTAPGSSNFQNSLTWYPNPYYQVMSYSQGRRFLGRVNVSPARLNGEDVLIIDATEFSPHALDEGKRYPMAIKGFKMALRYWLDFATRSGRKLYSVTFSNSSDYLLELGSIADLDDAAGDLTWVASDDDVRRILNLKPDIAVHSFYQLTDDLSRPPEELDGFISPDDAIRHGTVRRVVDRLSAENLDLKNALDGGDGARAAAIVCELKKDDEWFRKFFAGLRSSDPSRYKLNAFDVEDVLKSIYRLYLIETEASRTTQVTSLKRIDGLK